MIDVALVELKLHRRDLHVHTIVRPDCCTA